MGGLIIEAMLNCNSKSVKRIVVTASCASVLQSGYKPPVRFDESSWNEPAIKDVRENGSKTLPSNVYRASKTLAEKGELSSLFQYVVWR